MIRTHLYFDDTDFLPVAQHSQYLPYLTPFFLFFSFFLYFGANTMWYWHRYFVCDKLFTSFFICLITSCCCFVYGCQTRFHYNNRRLFTKVLFPQHNWGLFFAKAPNTKGTAKSFSGILPILNGKCHGASWMFFCKEQGLLMDWNMGINLCCRNRTVSQKWLYISNIDSCFQ